MPIQLKSAVAGALAAACAGSAAVLGLGMLDNAAAEPAKPAVPKVGTAYMFVDHDLTPNAQIVSYTLPKLPPGPYAVSIFAGLEPSQQIADENLYCQVADISTSSRVVFATAHWQDSAATAISGASAVRVTAESELRVECSGEHVKFRYGGDRLRVTFVRLASMKTTRIQAETHG